MHPGPVFLPDEPPNLPAELAPMAGVLMLVLLKSVLVGASIEDVVPHETLVTATLALVTLVAALLVWLPRNRRLFGALVINTAASVVVAIDRVHLRFYGEPGSVAELRDAWQLPSLAGAVMTKATLADLLVFADIPLALAFASSYRRRMRGRPEAVWRLRRTWSLTFGLTAFLAAIQPAIVMARDTDHVFEWRSSRSAIAGVLGILPYHVFDVATFLKTEWQRVIVSADDRNEARKVIEARRQTLRQQVAANPAYRGRNLIVIQAESLQDFAVGAKVNGDAVTPHLDAFAAESLRFRRFYDQTGFGATSDSLFIGMQSLHALPEGQGAIATRFETNEYRGLPEVLAEAGYSTFAAIGAGGKYWGIERLLTRLGFKHSAFDTAFPDSEHFGQGVADGDFFRQSVPMIQALRPPFMALLISGSNHAPYELPAAHRALRLGSLASVELGRYLDSVHYFDKAFGAFISSLRQSGLLDSSIVVVYGDHQGWLDNSPELASVAGMKSQTKFEFWKLHRRLPLLVRLPGGESAGPRETIGGHLDLAPTLLALLGIDSGTSVHLGSNLLQDTDEMVTFRDGSLVNGDTYLVLDPQVNVRPACYDDRTGAEVRCEPLEPARRTAREELRISDIIIRGNLVPTMGGR